MKPRDDEINLARYQRQMILPQMGQPAQRRLSAARVLLVGCGAIGCAAVEQLVRAGIGFIRIADRDIVETTNLQRQVLFDESDANETLPKSIAAARRLARINSGIHLDPLVMDVDAYNIERIVDVDVLIDGTDNVQTRYLINDTAVKRAIPWIYGACVGTEGRVMEIHPGKSACLRCVYPAPPKADELPTCDTAGVLGPAAAVVGAIQAAAAIRILSGQVNSVKPGLLSFDVWSGRFHFTPLDDARRQDCPACGLRQFEFLQNPNQQSTTRLCGRDAVQISPPRTARAFDMDAAQRKLSSVAQVRRTAHLVRASLEAGIQLTVFTDGRVIVHGTSDAARARSIYARFIGD